MSIFGQVLSKGKMRASRELGNGFELVIENDLTVGVWQTIPGTHFKQLVEEVLNLETMDELNITVDALLIKYGQGGDGNG